MRDYAEFALAPRSGGDGADDLTVVPAAAAWARVMACDVAKDLGQSVLLLFPLGAGLILGV